MDNKYGQLYTADDVRKAIDKFVAIYFPQESDRPWTEEGQAPLGDVIDSILKLGEYHFPADEPLFLLRGQDNSAGDFVEDYADTQETRGRPTAFVKLIRKGVSDFRYFAEHFPDRMKDPD